MSPLMLWSFFSIAAIDNKNISGLMDESTYMTENLPNLTMSVGKYFLSHMWD